MNVKTLWRMGQTQSGRRKLEAARDAAWDAIAEGNGAQIVSGSGNGMAFTVASGGNQMTTDKFFDVVSLALAHLDAGTFPGSAQVRFPR